MEDLRDFGFEHPKAQRLADLAGIMRDLELSVEACELFLRSPSVGSRDAILSSKAIGAFAILTYFRTFSTGVRSGIARQAVDRLAPHLQSVHTKLKAVRDQYLAHSVNQQEVNSVGVVLQSDNSLHAIGTVHSRPAAFSCEDIRDLRELAQALMVHMDEEYGLEFNALWDFLVSLPVEGRLKLLQAKPGSSVNLDWRAKQRKFRA